MTPLVYNKEHPNYERLINWFLPLKPHIKATYSLENYHANCRVIAKVVPDSAEFIMVLNFKARCSYITIM